MKRWIAAFLLPVMVLALLPAVAMGTENETTPMYRLYNPNSGEHFYTGSAQERDDLVKAGWKYEGVAWNAPIFSGEPVYRVFNPNSGDHHHTSSVEERENLVSLGWILEGIGWFGTPPEGHEHSYESVVTAPTCDSKGYTTHKCSNCGDSYKDTETAALGHDWGTGR